MAARLDPGFQAADRVRGGMGRELDRHYARGASDPRPEGAIGTHHHSGIHGRRRHRAGNAVAARHRQAARGSCGCDGGITRARPARRRRSDRRSTSTPIRASTTSTTSPSAHRLDPRGGHRAPTGGTRSPHPNAARRRATRYSDIVTGRIVMEHERESTIMTRSGEPRLIRLEPRYCATTRKGVSPAVASLGEDVTAIRAAEDEATARCRAAVASLVVELAAATVVSAWIERSSSGTLPRPTCSAGARRRSSAGRSRRACMTNDRWAIGRDLRPGAQGRADGPRADRAEPAGRPGSPSPPLRRRPAATAKGSPMSVGMQAVDVTLAWPWRSSCAKRRRWRQSAGWPAALPTTSTTA